MLPEQPPGQDEAEPSPVEKATQMVKSIHESSLQARVMKPLVSTSGMKEGSINEVYVLRGLPSYLQSNTSILAKGRPGDSGLGSRGYRLFQDRKLSVEYIRSTGLVASKSSEMLADSPMHCVL